MILRILCVLIAVIGLSWSMEPVAALPAEPVDVWVDKFHPDIFALGPDRKPVHRMTDAFFTPASDVARDMTSNNTFNLLVFLPFLLLPQVLLLYVIFKFRDRRDGRKAATFMGNHGLEIVWTAIPMLALVIVSIPIWPILWKMELPPESTTNALNVEVRGKKFAWDYQYLSAPESGLGIGQDVNGNQEALVLVKDRTTILNITSNDVNHAWWVPAFGVKKDAVIGRYNNTWFTPDTLGVYKGQCAELCGQGHGIMWISAVVVTPEDFAIYKTLAHHRNDTQKVWNAVWPGPGKEPDAAQLDAAVAAFLIKEPGHFRAFALRYWMAYNFSAVQRRPPVGLTGVGVATIAASRRAAIERSIATHGVVLQ